MISFSQRKGIKPVESVVQVDSMSSDLRNGLWNALSIFYWDRMSNSVHLSAVGDINFLLKRIWHYFFKKPLDTLDDYWPITYKEIREYYFKCHWYDTYDFIEFVVNNYNNRDQSINKKFMDFCNSVLERELSAYRFINGQISQITTEEEISEIEEALEATESLKPVRHHLKRGLDLLSDRKSPDYRNSIKESISAVEAICKLIAKDKKASLGQALKEIENKTELHSQLKTAFGNLYNYTSDAQGIRHALLDETRLDFEDAKFMLVSCSTFINYLIAKSSKAGITI